MWIILQSINCHIEDFELYWMGVHSKFTIWKYQNTRFETKKSRLNRGVIHLALWYAFWTFLLMMVLSTWNSACVLSVNFFMFRMNKLIYLISFYIRFRVNWKPWNTQTIRSFKSDCFKNTYLHIHGCSKSHLKFSICLDFYIPINWFLKSTFYIIDSIK